MDLQGNRLDSEGNLLDSAHAEKPNAPTKLPDVVTLNLDDASLPLFPRKPARADENEKVAKEFLLPGKSINISLCWRMVYRNH